MSTTTDPNKTHEFKAEIRQLLEILTHSVYTSKDVFLRELISNATDALEKVRFLQVGGTELHSPEIPLEIRVETKADEAGKILVIADSGIGMTADEVHENIGTIAHSGAAHFLEQLTQAGKEDEKSRLSLIGRFGIGFYSVFMVAEKVVVTTRSANRAGQTVVWTSDGLGSYSIETLDGDQPRGTRIEIHLKKEDERFADPITIQATIKRYSNFVPFPVLVNGERVNQATALWREPESQVKADQYNEFYKLISHDLEDPLAHLHFSVDAPLQYSALLFVPAADPEIMGFGRGEVSLQLYVKRVLIDHENKDLLPKYLRFVKGVVESDDLPLNVSRETLQENRVVMKMREGLTRRLLDLFLEMAKDKPQEYQTFWRQFGRILKEGYSDFSNREKIQNLLRFNSSRHSNREGLIGLAEYVEKMGPGQTAIYYLSGPSRDALERDPRLELFRERGIEVLYLDELADEFVLANLGKYHDKLLVSADQVKPDDVKDLGTASEEPAKETPAAEADLAPVLRRAKEILGDRVIDVRASQRLVDSPACLVTEENAMSGHMDKVMRLMNKSTELPQRILELNPRHSLLRHLAQLVSKDPNDPFIARALEQLFEGCMLMDGYLADPHKLVERMNQVLDDAAGLKAGSGK